MLNVIPRFINKKYHDGIMQGDFECSALIVDITGFTSITERLMEQGKEGAENVSDLINRIYRPLINYVYSKNGFITGFAGDAFTVVFSDAENENSTLLALEVARKMQRIMKHQKRFQKVTNLGYSIAVRIGISHGRTSWKILGSGQQKTYLFAGEVIVNCAEAIKRCEPGGIELDKYALNFIGTEEGKALATGKSSTGKYLGRVRKTIVRAFVPDKVIQYPLTGEFRDVASVFIRIILPENNKEIEGFITSSLSYARYYGSYCNGLFLDDKGLHMLMVFGAPEAHEDNVQRSVNFAIALRNEFGKNVSIGIAYGTVYAGLVGSQKRGTYTVIGKAVNLAARLMQHSDPGEILIAGKIVDFASKSFTINKHKVMSFKGKAEPVKCYYVVAKQYRSKRRLFKSSILGRTDELTQLLTDCEPIFSGHFAGITYIYGEAGIGKSRIVSEFCERLEDRAESIILQCDSIHHNSFHPFIYGLKNYFHQSEQNSRQQNNQYFEDNFRMLIRALERINDERKDDILSELIRTKSFSAALLGYFYEDSLYSQIKPEDRHTNTIAAIKVVLKAISLIQPLIIIQEDLHWIDEDSQKAYATILRNISDYPIVIIALSRYRDDFTAPVLSVSANTSVNVIKLKHLSRETTEKLINDRLGISANDKLLELISKQSEGNPFYIEQFCMYLTENNLINQLNQKDSSFLDSIEVPEGIRSVIITRLDRLTSGLRKLVQNASILGREFEITVLSLMLQTGQINDLVNEGESKSIWFAISEILYIFKHAMLQSVAYDMQLRKRQRNLHKLAAESLEQLYADDRTRYQEIAYHFEKAECVKKAIEYLFKAFEYSKSEYRLNESRNLLERLVKYPNTDEEAGQFYYDLGIVCFDLGAWKISEEHLETCFRLFDKAGLYRRKAIAQSTLAGNVLLASNQNKAVELANESFIYGQKVKNNEIISHALSSLGLIEQNKSKYETAVNIFEQALNHARLTGLLDLITFAIYNLSACYMMIGRNEKAIKFMNEGLALAKKINDLRHIAEFQSHLGQTYLFQKKYDTARIHFEEALLIAKKVGAYIHIARALGSLGSLHFYLGDYNQSAEYLSRDVEICEENGNTFFLTTALYNLAETNIRRSEYETAKKLIARALMNARERNDVLYEGVLTYLKALIEYETGNFKLGKELNDKALPAIESMQWRDGVFHSTLLKAKLISVDNKESARGLLLSMANEYKEPEYLAYINYEVYKIDGSDEYHKKALNQFTELYRNEGQSRVYKELIEELVKYE